MSDTVHLGPFALDTKIGEGGMGVVFRAHHLESAEPIAIKVLLAEVARRPELQQDFRREIQALATLHHPGIAAIADYGRLDAETASRGPAAFADGAPWFAMQDVGGDPLGCDASGWNWDAAESLLVQILDALAHAHARSIVHRDLKPGNIMVEATGPDDPPTVHLVDFGVARIFEPSAHDASQSSNRAPGTPTYMAPEQIRGDWRDQGPWTDLYALGCLTWRLVCGSPPFDGSEIGEVLDQHLHARPTGFSPRFRVPEDLEGWIRGLMTKDIESRTRRAADAAWSLLNLGPPAADTVSSSPAVRDTETAEEPPPTVRTFADTLLDPSVPTGEETLAETGPAEETQPGTDTDHPPGASTAEVPPILPDWRRDDPAGTAAVLPKAGLQLFALREIPVVGREAERDQLWKALGEVRQSASPSMVTLAGQTGTGKSRLARWLCHRAHETGAATTVPAPHPESAEHDEGLRALARWTFRTAGLSRSEVFTRLGERLPTLENDRQMRLTDARALTELLRPTPDDAESVDGPRYRFSHADQKYALLVRLFRRLSKRRPLVLWFDDLQWGPETIRCLQKLFTTQGHCPPVLIVATVRSDVLREEPTVERQLTELEQTAGARHLDLAPLSNEDHRTLIGRLLDLSPALADRLAERTEGNPLFAIQLLRDWVDRGLLETGPRGFRLREGVDLEVPETIHRLWLDRIERLLEPLPASRADAAWQSLELAAALGRKVRGTEWGRLLDAAGLSPPDGLVDRLVEQGLVDPEMDGWSFTHGLLVETLARRAREAGRWKRHHRVCARILESILDGDLPGPRERLAEHWVAAGRTERALAPMLDALRAWADRDADEEPRRLLARRTELLDDLQLPDDDPRRLAQRLERGRLLAKNGALERASSLLEEIWETLDDDHPALQSRVAGGIAFVEKAFGHTEVALEWAHASLEASRRTGDPALESRCHTRLAWRYTVTARPNRGEHHAREALESARRADDDHSEVKALRALAYTRDAQGEEGSGELYERVRRRAAEAGYVGQEARALNGLGERARFAGHLDEAREYYRRFRQKIQELSRPAKAALTQLNLAQVELAAGNFHDARDLCASAAATFEAIGAETGREDILHTIRLTRAAGVADEKRFRRLWAKLEDGWPEEWRVIKDHPWLLEKAGRYADEAGWADEARQVWRLARDLWERLGDEEAAEALEQRLS